MSARDRISSEQLRLWTVGAVCAVALHVGLVAFAVAKYQANEQDDVAGESAMEIGLQLTQETEPQNLPPGPPSEASTAAPDVAAQEAEAKQEDLPKAVPTETENPDQVVALKEQPKEDKPEPEKVQAPASQASVASEAAAPQQAAKRTKERMRQTWQKELVAHLDRHKRYPGERFQSAAVIVGLVLDRSGHVVSSSIVKSSGDKAFDDAAIAMLRRSDPVPPPPPLIADDGLSFTLPVNFRAKGRS
ncbi:MAG: TonB family protein [Pseudomonadota bacterium]|jgi:TonB family protein